MHLRLDEHAQEEIRLVAAVVAECARAVAPVSFAAFLEHQRFAVRFGASELAVVRAALRERLPIVAELAAAWGLSGSRQRELLAALEGPGAAGADHTPDLF